MGKWQQYLDVGWQLAELRPGSKAPKHNHWQDQGTPFDTASWGAGLVHQWSGTCAIDIDDVEKAEAWLSRQGIVMSDLFAHPDAVQIVSGKANHGKLLYRLPEALRSKKIIEDRRNIIDFRCIGNQDVLPPTIHPETKQPYAWVGYDPLFGLPPLPAALEALWRSLVRPATETRAEPVVPATAGADAIAELLASKDPDCDRETWIGIGQAVHAATNGQGFYLWDNWARRGEKYLIPEMEGGPAGSALLMSKWMGFRADGGRGLGTLLQDQVAKPEEFPIETPTSEFTGQDETNTMIGKAQMILRERVVYLTHQEKWWPTPVDPPVFDFDTNAPGMMTADGVRNIFTRHMPVIETKLRSYHLDPVDLWRKIRDPRVAYGVGFLPNGPQLFDDPNDGRRYVNSYKPYNVEPIRPSGSDREAWAFLLSRIQDDHYRLWLQQYFAYLVRNPGHRVTCAPLLFGASTGTGKTTLLAEQVPALLFGAANVDQMSNDTLKGQFNDQVANIWILTMDELKMGKLDRIETSNKIKSWITGKTLPVHPKGGKPYKITNRLQITATSNYGDAAHLENNDRRWAVCEMLGPGFTEQECADLYEGFLNTPEAAGKLRYLMNEVDLTGFSPTGRPPETAGRREMIVAGLGGWEAKLAELALAGAAPFDKDVLELDKVRDALIGTNAPNLMRIVGLMKQAGFETAMLRHHQGARLYAWRNMREWTSLGYGAAAKYLEDGVRPFEGTDALPVAIQKLASDDGDPESVDDLLGDASG